MGPEKSGPSSAQAKISEQDILAARKGDWTAKANLVRVFTPLLTALANKRVSEPARVNEIIEAGKEGLLKAAKRYKPSVGAAKFQVFALDYIEASMDRQARRGRGGFFARLFGR